MVKRRKGWRKSCDVGEVTESLENEQSSYFNGLLVEWKRRPICPTSASINKSIIVIIIIIIIIIKNINFNIGIQTHKEKIAETRLYDLKESS